MVIKPAGSVQDAALFVLHAASLPTTSGIVIQIFPLQGGSVLEYVDVAGRNSGFLLNHQTHAPTKIWNSYGTGNRGKSPHFPQPKHSLNAEQPSLSAGSTVYRLPPFRSSNEVHGFFMNVSRVRT